MLMKIRSTLGTTSVRAAGHRRLLDLGLFSIIGWSVLHLLLGSNPLLVMAFSLIAATGFLALWPARLKFSNIFVFGLAMNSGYAALAVKGLLLQPLQTNLLQPYESAAYLVIGFLVIAACAMAAQVVVGSKSAGIVRRINNPQFASRVVLPLILVGTCTKVLHTVFTTSNESEGGFGGFGTFNFVLILAISLLMFLLSTRPSQKYKLLLVGSCVLVFLLSVVHNTKKEIFDLVFVLALSIYAFDFKLRFRHIALSTTALAVLIFFVSPAIHLMRSGFAEESLVDRMSTFYSIVEKHNFNPFQLATAEGDFFSGFDYSYSEAGSYVYPSKANVDRFLLIKPIDIIANGIDKRETLGFSVFWKEMLEKVLPSALIVKSPESGVDLIAWRYGMRDPSSVARPVIGFIGSSLACGGLWGVVVFPALFLLPVLILIDYVFGAIKNSVWGLFGTATCMFLIEREFEVMLPFLLRDLIVMVVFSYLLWLVARPHRRPV